MSAAHVALHSTPALMGIVNVTPDSFSDGGLHLAPAQAAAHARQLVQDGATLLDVGAESTRPGSAAVPPQEQLARLLPALQAIMSERLGVPISVDTRSAEVARQALAHGASILNDVSAHTHNEMFALAREQGCTLVLMHGYPAVADPSGAPAQVAPDYAETIFAALLARAEDLERRGIARTQLWLDPGLGFGKGAAQSLALLANLDRLVAAGYPVMVGPSRKRFLGATKVSQAASPDALTATACALAVAQGAQVLRIHCPKTAGPHVRLAQSVARLRTTARALAPKAFR